jgi:hypothetical protein
MDARRGTDHPADDDVLAAEFVLAMLAARIPIGLLPDLAWPSPLCAVSRFVCGAVDC